MIMSYACCIALFVGFQYDYYQTTRRIFIVEREGCLQRSRARKIEWDQRLKNLGIWYIVEREGSDDYDDDDGNGLQM